MNNKSRNKNKKQRIFKQNKFSKLKMIYKKLLNKV